MIFVCSQEELGGKRKMQTISFENVADQWLTLKKNASQAIHFCEIPDHLGSSS